MNKGRRRAAVLVEHRGPGGGGGVREPSARRHGLQVDHQPDAGSRPRRSSRSPPPSPPHRRPRPDRCQHLGPAAAALATLAVKGRAPKTGYDRDAVRPGVERRRPQRLRHPQRHPAPRPPARRLKAGTHGCVVLTGTLADPYTGATIAFVRGRARRGGADRPRRGAVRRLAEGRPAAGRGAPRPPSPTTRSTCWRSTADQPAQGGRRRRDLAAAEQGATGARYVARQVAVKAAYGLWVTPAEKDAIGRVLATCPAQPLPVGAGVGVWVAAGARRDTSCLAHHLVGVTRRGVDATRTVTDRALSRREVPISVLSASCGDRLADSVGRRRPGYP